MIPPMNLSDRWIGISREPQGSAFVFYFENGDTYELNSEEAETFLRLIKVPEGYAFLDYIQNFYNGILDITNYFLVQVTREQLIGVFGEMSAVKTEDRAVIRVAAKNVIAGV